MEAHKCFEPVSVSAGPALRAQLHYRDRLLKHRLQFRFVSLLNPDEHAIDIVCLECLLGCPDDRAIDWRAARRPAYTRTAA